MAKYLFTPCVDCKQPRLEASSLPGMVKCAFCGKLQLRPKEEDKRASEIVPAEADVASSPEFTIPDYTEVMIGWRAWGVPINETMAPRLYSVTHRTNAFWPPREVYEAMCDKKRGRANGAVRSGHAVPEEKCTCGLYSAKTREHLQSMNYHYYDADARGMFHVMGTVSLWGKVIEGGQGWRAQFGYPRELFVPFEAHKLAKPLSEEYGIPVRLNNILA